MLSVTKIADGSVKLRLSDQVVDDIVSESLRHIDRRSAEHHITVDCGDVPLLVRVDAGLIMQVLINLMNNAVKYTPAGSNIRITAIRRGNAAEICVSDNGPGIPDELKERVLKCSLPEAIQLVTAAEVSDLDLRSVKPFSMHITAK